MKYDDSEYIYRNDTIMYHTVYLYTMSVNTLGRRPAYTYHARALKSVSLATRPDGGSKGFAFVTYRWQRANSS